MGSGGRQEADGYRLVVVGDFNESNYGRWCKNMSGENVVFLGAVYGELLTELYSNAALVVLSSSLEGMSMTLLEAAGFGRCVLASDIPENRDVMGDSIVYFSKDDSRDLGMKIRDLIQNNSDSVRNSYGQNARSVVTSNYSWPLTTVRFQEVYCRVLSRR
jgi:glycosyltransferase involved in cell wall biosynthesis